jgi:hypothetical protein
VTARSHFFTYGDRRLILAAISSMKTQPSQSMRNIFCIICAYIHLFILIKYSISYIKFNDKSLSEETLLPNNRLKQGGMSPQNK